MQFQWYPGHMTKAKRQMQEDIKLIDLVIELVDARIPLSSRNPDIDELGKNKARLIIMTLYDYNPANSEQLFPQCMLPFRLTHRLILNCRLTALLALRKTKRCFGAELKTWKIPKRCFAFQGLPATMLSVWMREPRQA